MWDVVRELFSKAHPTVCSHIEGWGLLLHAQADIYLWDVVRELLVRLIPLSCSHTEGWGLLVQVCTHLSDNSISTSLEGRYWLVDA